MFFFMGGAGGGWEYFGCSVILITRLCVGMLGVFFVLGREGREGGWGLLFGDSDIAVIYACRFCGCSFGGGRGRARVFLLFRYSGTFGYVVIRLFRTGDRPARSREEKTEDHPPPPPVRRV